jgi:hypothetical protein
LTSAPVLQLPDFTRSFIVDCDASGSGFGAILHQGNMPIAFFSRTVSPHHARLAAYERELIDLSYMWTRSFIMCTDHYNLKYLLDQRLSTILQHDWVSKLFGFQFYVEFKPDRLNATADALSRRDEELLSVHALSSPDFEFYEQFYREVASLPKIAATREEIRADHTTKEWRVIDDMVVYADRLLLPVTSLFWTQAQEHTHGMGHEGSRKHCGGCAT